MAIWRSEPSDYDEKKLAGIATSRDLNLCHAELRSRFLTLQAEFCAQNPGKTLLVTCTYRSPEEQNRLYRLGRKGSDIIDHAKVVTNCDGIITTSDHNKNPARAIDIAIVNGGKVTWDGTEYYPLGGLAKRHALEWGGFWTRGKPDYPHLYLPRDVA